MAGLGLDLCSGGAVPETFVTVESRSWCELLVTRCSAAVRSLWVVPHIQMRRHACTEQGIAGMDGERMMTEWIHTSSKWLVPFSRNFFQFLFLFYFIFHWQGRHRGHGISSDRSGDLERPYVQTSGTCNTGEPFFCSPSQPNARDGCWRLF